MVPAASTSPNMTDTSKSRGAPVAALGEWFSDTYYGLNCGLKRGTSDKRCRGGRVQSCDSDTWIGAYVPYGTGCIDRLDQMCL